VDPQLSAAAIALLFGAAKIGLIGTVGFAIAWMRARSRIKALEEHALRQVAPGIDERIDRIEQSVEYIASQIERVVEAQERAQQLPPGARER
jgi:hypothetical protein